MKPIKFLFATMIALLALVTLPSCSDDNNEDEPAVPAAKAIAGTYAGDMECSVMGSASTFENLSFSPLRHRRRYRRCHTSRFRRSSNGNAFNHYYRRESH